MNRKSLLGYFARSTALAVFLFMSAWTVLAAFWLYDGAITAMEREADRQISEVSTALAPLVWNLDERSIMNYLQTKRQNPEILAIDVTEDIGGHLWRVSSNAVVSASDSSIQRRAEVEYSNVTTGSVTMKFSLEPRKRQVMENILALILSQTLVFFAVLAALALAWLPVSQRLRGMVKTIVQFTEKEQQVRMAWRRSDELGILSQGFNTMADRIEATTLSMEQEIQQRTERLMESEKLALVGSLVAGVAHEINTPVGNGITMASWLVTRTRDIRALVSASHLSQAELSEFLTDLESGLSLMQSGLDRTANLILAFKKIGADQVVDERRSIALHPFLTEILVSLNPTLRRFPHTVVLQCAEDLYVENHSGALFQIITNLILNAHHHAFQPDQQGTITVEAKLVGDGQAEFQLSVRDDGAGIPPAVQAQIFQPFFTTKRLEGGTGLGLSIVHNLVKNLGGVIECKSVVGKGSEFVVTLPRVAPER